jgi:septum formation protein
MPALVLASQSPRRAELLRQLGASFTVCPAHIDETRHGGEAVADYVRRMAAEKAAAVARDADAVILAADTTVAIGDDCLGKPADRDAAHAMLERLSGSTHRVASAVCVRAGPEAFSCLVETAVTFCTLDARDIAAYIATGEPWDKAGGYGIQGLAGAFVQCIDGSYSNVVGLPLVETRELLARAGVQTLIGGEAAQ